jgi:hypothetical protein
MTKKREGSFDFAQDDKLWGIGDDNPCAREGRREKGRSFDFAQDDKLWGIGDDKFGGVRDGNFYAGYTPTPRCFSARVAGKGLRGVVARKSGSGWT